MEIEKQAIKIIESLNRIMTSYKYLVIRRTLINIFSLIIFIQLIITTKILIQGKDIPVTWVQIIGIEFGAWTVMVTFYFRERHYKNKEEKELNKNKRVFQEKKDENNRESIGESDEGEEGNE